MKLKRRNCFLIYIYYNLSKKKTYIITLFLSFFLSFVLCITRHFFLLFFFLSIVIFIGVIVGCTLITSSVYTSSCVTIHSKSCHQLSQVVFCYRYYIDFAVLFKFCWLFYKCSGLTFYEVLVELRTFDLN